MADDLHGGFAPATPFINNYNVYTVLKNGQIR
nr:MAG TPA: hypothetical protein [Caudoviricetes sp.]